MTLASFGFFVFLCTTYVLWRYAARGPASRNAVLLIASYYFYCSWDLRFAAVLATITLVQWSLGQRIHSAASDVSRRQWLWASVSFGLGCLAYFKYMGFFAGELRDLMTALGMTKATAELAPIVAPIGISFYTFQSLSYTIDIHARRTLPTDLGRFALFLSFFASVTSGPITRASQLVPQLERPVTRPGPLEAAAVLLVFRGLVKKIVFADVLAAHFVEPAFAQPGAWSSGFLLLSVIAYSFQIYMDLSGYTDMARGAARCFGYDLAVNFNRPYLATSVSNFWQRWHMSMSRFFRDYLYFALGGSRRGNVYANLMITFVAIGLWHGAGWTFVVYGLLHGSAVCLERRARERRKRAGTADPGTRGWSRTVAIARTFAFVSLVRVLFVTSDLGAARDFFGALLTGGGSGAAAGVQGYLTLLAAIAAHAAPREWQDGFVRRFVDSPVLLQAAAMTACVYLMILLGVESRPFVYFNF